MKRILALPLLVLVFSFTVNAEKKTDSDPVVAKVNGKIIRKSTLLNYHRQSLNYISTKKVTMERSLNDLINRIVGIDKAKSNKLEMRPDNVKKMNDILYHAQISDDLAPMLQKISVTDEDIKKYYKTNPEYKTSQILLRLRAIPSQDEVAKQLALSLEIHKKIVKNPKSFEELVPQYGQTPSAPTAGGDLGYQPRVKLAPEYFESINGKKIGTFTRPFRTQHGIHIVKITGLKTFGQIDMGLYKKIVYDVKRDKILDKYFVAERAKAKIKIYKKEMK